MPSGSKRRSAVSCSGLHPPPRGSSRSRARAASRRAPTPRAVQRTRSSRRARAPCPAPPRTRRCRRRVGSAPCTASRRAGSDSSGAGSRGRCRWRATPRRSAARRGRSPPAGRRRGTALSGIAFVKIIFHARCGWPGSTYTLDRQFFVVLLARDPPPRTSTSTRRCRPVGPHAERQELPVGGERELAFEQGRRGRACRRGSLLEPRGAPLDRGGRARRAAKNNVGVPGYTLDLHAEAAADVVRQHAVSRPAAAP